LLLLLLMVLRWWLLQWLLLQLAAVHKAAEGSILQEGRHW
jgi:hypothetical protein